MKTKFIVSISNESTSCLTKPVSRRWIWNLPILSVTGLLLALSTSRTVAQSHSIWNDSTVPAIVDSADPNSVELGVKFRSSVNGSITGIRFYKAAGNTGTHIGALWTGSGTLLGAVQFANESASGWQQQAMSSPVAIQSNTTYIVSYHAPNGMYSVDVGYFASSGFNNGPLRALGDGEDGLNGLFAYAIGGVFPTQSFNSANYWVDVVFEPEAKGCFGDTNPPVIVVPPDVILGCNDCNVDPLNTGIATATDECTFTITNEEIVIGDCPKVVKRTWIATDENGNTSSATQTISCFRAPLVTDGDGCSFDRNLSTDVADFRLIFNEDPKNLPCHRLIASNPGQFLFNVFYLGDPGKEITLNLKVPYPFVTQGAKPIHAYDWVTVGSSDAHQCLLPGKEILASPQQIALTNYGALPNKFTTLPVTLKVPASGVVYLTVHLDYGLKKTTGYKMSASGDALECATGTKILVPNHNDYVFSVAGDFTGSASVKNYNDFKQNSGDRGLKLKNPNVKPSLTSSTGGAGQFEFSVTGPENQVVVIEMCTNLIQQIWIPVRTNVISGGTLDFSDLRRTDLPNCYYRIRTP